MELNQASNQRPAKKVARNLSEHREENEEQKVFTALELFEMGITEFPMLLDPIFPKAGLTVLAGSSDTGKSTFLRQMAIAIARGDEKFLGWTIKAEHNRVIYVSTEDDKIAISHLLNQTIDGNGDIQKLENLKYLFSLDNPFDELDAILSEYPADCIIIDAFSDLFPGEMNQANKVRTFMKPFFELVNRHNCLVIFLHHTGKRTEENPPSKNNLLGSQGIEGKARLVIELRRDPYDSSFRHLCIVKGNYVEDDLKTYSYKLLFKDRQFEMTDERADFDDLVVNPDEKQRIKEKKLARVVELKDKDMSFEEIAAQMNKEGLNISKSTAHNYYKEAERREAK
ncbi:AAA family ATPase [Prolixibacter denitrificans]|uniref:AAA domain-containing protein n=1 Tax=Prolixibacter denitrificans TaxID=1541063 RepID=A0A2P8CHQ8_9BACT|nr:AAA family ATPase [Prolixibacter denitrificans]PSK84510.1 AAA domain-containing protein [Prolixibacter denitrificans]GET20683.1 hypothetical protein JCM18694_09290 [Prolixibacter denitrificans]